MFIHFLMHIPGFSGTFEQVVELILQDSSAHNYMYNHCTQIERMSKAASSKCKFLRSAVAGYKTLLTLHLDCIIHFFDTTYIDCRIHFFQNCSQNKMKTVLFWRSFLIKNFSFLFVVQTDNCKKNFLLFCTKRTCFSRFL